MTLIEDTLIEDTLIEDILINVLESQISKYINPSSLICEHFSIYRKEQILVLISQKTNIAYFSKYNKPHKERKNLLENMSNEVDKLIIGLPTKESLIKVPRHSIDGRWDQFAEAIPLIVTLRAMLCETRETYNSLLNGHMLPINHLKQLKSNHSKVFKCIMRLNDMIFTIEKVKV